MFRLSNDEAILGAPEPPATIADARTVDEELAFLDEPEERDLAAEHAESLDRGFGLVTGGDLVAMDEAAAQWSADAWPARSW